MTARGVLSTSCFAARLLFVSCLALVPLLPLWGASAGTGTKTEEAAETRRPDRRLLTRVEPIYPETLRSLKIGGVVRLAVTVLPNGAVESVELLGGNPILAEAAIKAVRQWIYAPGSARTKVQVTIRFHQDH